MTKHTENKKSRIKIRRLAFKLGTSWIKVGVLLAIGNQEWSKETRKRKLPEQATTEMADQPTSSTSNPLPHSRGGRHRSRKQQKPSTAEREQKKASRLQALGPAESIKEKQVSYTFNLRV